MERDLPLAKRMDALAAKFGTKGDWRGPAPKRTDSGIRPPLADLGPMHWHPPAGRAWSATNAEGKTVSDKDFRGKNVLLCLYLGHQCGHCMEQLNAIADVAGDLKKAGIEVAAISLEKPEELSKANEKSKTKGGFPFPSALGCRSEGLPDLPRESMTSRSRLCTLWCSSIHPITFAGSTSATTPSRRRLSSSMNASVC
jgi:hypothetical protein